MLRGIACGGLIFATIIQEDPGDGKKDVVRYGKQPGSEKGTA